MYLSVTAVPSPLPELPAAVEVAAYHIVMEAINNVARHASAKLCRVSLEASEILTLEITDDGGGFSGTAKPGVGMTSMRDRAAELGGKFNLTTNKHGTSIKADLPC